MVKNTTATSSHILLLLITIKEKTNDCSQRYLCNLRRIWVEPSLLAIHWARRHKVFKKELRVEIDISLKKFAFRQLWHCFSLTNGINVYKYTLCIHFIMIQMNFSASFHNISIRCSYKNPIWYLYQNHSRLPAS